MVVMGGTTNRTELFEQVLPQGHVMIAWRQQW